MFINENQVKELEEGYHISFRMPLCHLLGENKESHMNPTKTAGKLADNGSGYPQI
jgi:hypothetical protein